jgi:hypothetical protein
MKVQIKLIGCSPANSYWAYHALCENGHADILYERTFFKNGEYEMPDAAWSEGSGWANLKCDKCGTEYRERVYPGMVVACPVCSEPELVPDGVELESSNMMEEVV